MVPEFRDVEHAQREMAANGAVFGVRVARFGWLWDLIARRVGYSARIASSFQRELLVAEAVEQADLRVLAASARRPGFSRAAARFLAEVGRAGHRARRARQRAERVGRRREPPRLRGRDRTDTRGLPCGARARRAGRPRAVRVAHAERLPREPRGVGRHAGLRVRLRRLHGRRARRGRGARRARGRDAVVPVRARPARVRRPRRDVRPAARRRPTTHVELEGVPDHYETASRAPLHHLERHLFDAGGRPRRGRIGRPHPLGRRRAGRGRAGRRLRARAARGRHGGGRHRRRLPRSRPVRVTRRSGLLRLRHPVLARPARAARPHGARTRAARAAAMRAARARRDHRRPPDVPAIARSPRRSRPRRPAGGEGTPEGHPRRRRGARDLGGAERQAAADARSMPCGTRPATRRGFWPSSSAAWSGSSRVRTCAGRTSSAATRPTCRGRSPPRATRSRRCARSAAPLRRAVSSTTRCTT